MTQRQSDVNAGLIEQLKAHAEVVSSTLATSTSRDVVPLGVRGSSYAELDLATWAIPLSYVTFEDCVFDRVSFSRDAFGAQFVDCRLVDCRMGKTSFNGSIFRDSEILRCDLFRVSMLRCKFENVKFSKCNLARTSFSKCVWRDAVLERCRFVDASMVRPVEVSGLVVENPENGSTKSVIIDTGEESEIYRQIFVGFDIKDLVL